MSKLYVVKKVLFFILSPITITISQFLKSLLYVSEYLMMDSLCNIHSRND